MALYESVNGVARKVTKMYDGVITDIPIYETQVVDEDITTSNISTYFTVTNGFYYFAGSGSVFSTNNSGFNSSTAETTLTALDDMQVSFTYSYASETNYDKFTLTVAGNTIENAVSGAETIKDYSVTLAKGKSIVFKYVKDGSQHSNGDVCKFYNMHVNATKNVQTSTERATVARQVTKAYDEVDGVARAYFSSSDSSVVRWRKYSTNKSYGSWTTNNSFTNGDITRLRGFAYGYNATSYTEFGRSYGSSSTEGFGMISLLDSFTFTTSTTIDDMASLLIGNYYLHSDGDTDTRDIVRVSKIKSVSNLEYGTVSVFMNFTTNVVAMKERSISYNKGSTFYSEIVAQPGALPESGTVIYNGTIVSGSTSVDYYILKLSDGVIYYYERV